MFSFVGRPSPFAPLAQRNQAPFSRPFSRTPAKCFSTYKLQFTKRNPRKSEVEWEPLGVKLGLKPVIGTKRNPLLEVQGVIADPRGPVETILDAEELYTLKPSKGGAVRCLYINRTKALNTLKFSTVEFMSNLFQKWIANKIHSSVTVKGAGDKAFCSGIDWRSVYSALEKGDSKFVDTYMRKVYELHSMVFHSTKPIISVINGLALGATGCGLALNATFPLSTEKTVFALPETSMGFFPDCGMSYHLARVDHIHPGLGYFLGMTGYHLVGPDLAHLRLATHHILVHMVPPMESRLGLTVTEDPLRVMSAIEESQEPFESEKFSLEEHLPVIARCFTRDSVEEIIRALEGEIYSTWATDLAKKMRGMSPLSLKVTFRALREVIGKERMVEPEELQRRLEAEEVENKRRIKEYKEQALREQHRAAQRELAGKLVEILDGHKKGPGASVSKKERLRIASRLTERLQGLPEASDILDRVVSVESAELAARLDGELSKYLPFDDFLEQEAERRGKELEERANLMPSARKAVEDKEALEELEIKEKLGLKGYPYDIDGKTPEEFTKSLINSTEQISATFDMLEEVEKLEDLEKVLKSAEETFGQVCKLSPLPNFVDLLHRDFQIAARLMRTEDFKVGMRARVITNTTPKWKHASVEEVTDAEVDELFQPLDEAERLKLELPVFPGLKIAVQTSIEVENTTLSTVDQAIEGEDPEDEDLEEYETQMDQNLEATIRLSEIEGKKRRKKSRSGELEVDNAAEPPLEEEGVELEEEISNPEDRPSYRVDKY